MGTATMLIVLVRRRVDDAPHRESDRTQFLGDGLEPRAASSFVQASLVDRGVVALSQSVRANGLRLRASKGEDRSLSSTLALQSLHASAPTSWDKPQLSQPAEAINATIRAITLTAPSSKQSVPQTKKSDARSARGHIREIHRRLNALCARPVLACESAQGQSSAENYALSIRKGGPTRHPHVARHRRHPHRQDHERCRHHRGLDAATPRSSRASRY